jgi:hypothetical protein
MNVGDKVIFKTSGCDYEVVAKTEDGRAILSRTTPNNLLVGEQIFATDDEVWELKGEA